MKIFGVYAAQARLPYLIYNDTAQFILRNIIRYQTLYCITMINAKSTNTKLNKSKELFSLLSERFFTR